MTMHTACQDLLADCLLHALDFHRYTRNFQSCLSSASQTSFIRLSLQNIFLFIIFNLSIYCLGQEFGYMRMTRDIEPQFPAISEFLMKNPKLIKVLNCELLKYRGYTSLHLSFYISTFILQQLN